MACSFGEKGNGPAASADRDEAWRWSSPVSPGAKYSALRRGSSFSPLLPIACDAPNIQARLLTSSVGSSIISERPRSQSTLTFSRSAICASR